MFFNVFIKLFSTKMSTIIFNIVLFTVFAKLLAQSDIETVDLLQTGTYTWEGLNSENTTLTITAQKYSIYVTIEICDIGNPDATLPNEEYLILKTGIKNPISLDNGQIFAYIKKPKTLYFVSSSVILELRTPSVLTKKCEVTFGIGDHEDATLPPVTTTEAVSTYGPEVSKYSTVLIAGRRIDEFNQNKSLVLELKGDLAAMANDYSNAEGFCLTKNVESNDVEIYTLEQCPTQWPDFNNCVRLVYAIPVKSNASCSLWKGYQLNKEHLDLMWSRLASKYLKNGFSVYDRPEINNLVTWWIICMVLLTVLFAITIVALNLVWKRRTSFRRTETFEDTDYMTDTRKISEASLRPPYFQPIPPMFGKADNFEDKNGAENQGFHYNILHD